MLACMRMSEIRDLVFELYVKQIRIIICKTEKRGLKLFEREAMSLWSSLPTAV